MMSQSVPSARRLVAAGFALLLLAICAACAPNDPPDFTCRGIVTTWAGGDRPPYVTQSSDVFRVKDGKLYLSDATRQEYFYNTISEIVDGPERYLAGHKVFVLGGQPYVVHAGPNEARVTTVKCEALKRS
jgi:hypothetical protein